LVRGEDVNKKRRGRVISDGCSAEPRAEVRMKTGEEKSRGGKEA